MTDSAPKLSKLTQEQTLFMNFLKIAETGGKTIPTRQFGNVLIICCVKDDGFEHPKQFSHQRREIIAIVIRFIKLHHTPRFLSANFYDLVSDGYPSLALVAATCPAKDVTKVLSPVISDSSTNSPELAA